MEEKFRNEKEGTSSTKGNILNFHKKNQKKTMMFLLKIIPFLVLFFSF